jgi:site-specific recombinase XerD
MKHNRPNDLGRSVVRFFQDYLPTLRGMSQHTIRSYRDAVVLFFRFAAERTGRRIADLDLTDFTAAQIAHFLSWLETTRHNGIATRNARLAALHTFARFLTTEQPAYLAELQRVIGVPFKRGARSAPIEYLEQTEVEALLKGIDRSTSAGRRDYALFALMFNTGARVQEILDLRPSDVRLDPPYQVRLHGKGGKVRVCPIWADTSARLRALATRTASHPDVDAPLFANRHGIKLTRFAVRYLLRKHIDGCAAAKSLRDKHIHPHSLRHTTAIHLLKAGVDFATISQWLGHATLSTTMNYARADLDLKRQALAQVFPDVLAAPRAGRVALAQLDVVSWLRRL